MEMEGRTKKNVSEKEKWRLGGTKENEECNE